MLIGSGSVDATGHFAINVSPPLRLGDRIYARDVCNGVDGDPITVNAGRVAPAASLPLTGVLGMVLAAVGAWSLSRRQG